MGHNGAGKSTLLRLVTGLTRPNHGQVTVDGQSVRGAASVRRKIGLLAHESYLYGSLTARENLLLYAQLFSVAQPSERVDSVLADLGMAWAAELQVESMSRGMEQRVALGRALVHEPTILLLDEPFSGLDRAADRFLMERLASLREAGKTALLVTHDPTRAVRCVDRIVVLGRGRVQLDRILTPEDAETFPTTYMSLLMGGNR
jgi:heme exporter protein A